MPIVNTFLAVPFSGRGIGYTCHKLLEGIRGDDFEVCLNAPYLNSDLGNDIRHNGLWPTPLAKLVYRYARPQARRLVEKIHLSALKRAGTNQTISYLWSETSPAFDEELHNLKSIVVREKFNCGKATAKRILDEAYARLGISPQHGITDDAIRLEKARLEQADAVFCPNANVDISLAEIGIPESKRLRTSYGYDPARVITSEPAALAPIEGTTYLFVGSICVRKGAHLLLKAWAKSGVKGRLVLAGALEPIIETTCREELARADVVHLSYTSNVAALYKSADVFVFPSLEEGGPQVTYEAAANGLAAIVSPMGAGDVVRHGEEGHVLDPYAEDDWIEAIRLLDRNAGERQRMSDAIRTRAIQFEWPKVGLQRRTSLRTLL